MSAIVEEQAWMILRPARASDQAYVATSWVRHVDPRAHLVDRVLDRKTARIVIAHPPDDDNRINAWCCYEKAPRHTLVHMLFVRRDTDRKLGLGDDLLTHVLGSRRESIVSTAAVPQEYERRWNMTRMDLLDLLGVRP